MRKKCAVCGEGPMTKATSAERLEVAGRVFTAELPAERCKACGETVVPFDALEVFELSAARELVASGASSADAFRFMRKALGLRAADLAELLGVAAETVSRWETGHRDVDRGALALVGGLVVDRLEGSTATLDRLRALAQPPRTAKTKALELARTPKRRAV